VGDGPTVVLVVPIVPAVTGNGLAMRAGMLLDALAPVADVHVVVVPISGARGDREWVDERAKTLTVVDPVGPDRMRAHTTKQIADPDLRHRLERAAPLPARAVLVPPTLADDLVLPRPTALLAMRLYMAPLGVRLARRLEAARVVIDADDDDGTLLRALDDTDEADAFDRLAKAWLPDADLVTAASPIDATTIRDRTGLSEVAVLPNALVVPESVGDPPGADRLLFVGNLTYEPNVVAARVLASEVIPRVREQRPDATATLVGRHGADLDDLARLPGVELVGSVPEVASFYESTDLVVVPLRHGGGTRIKILEAFAHRRPVVATEVAIAGIDIDDDAAMIANTADELAHAVVSLLDDRGRAGDIAGRALRVVQTRYSPSVVAPLIRRSVLGAAQ
jgi:polysaccharide biosynthesis protein PslH